LPVICAIPVGIDLACHLQRHKRDGLARKMMHDADGETPALTATPTPTSTPTPTATPTPTPTATATSAGSSLQFDGTDDPVTLVNLPQWTQFTIEAWAKRTADGTSYGDILSDANAGYSQAMFTLYVDDGDTDCPGGPTYEYAYLQIPVPEIWCSGVQASLDPWQHVAVTRDASGTRRFYVDGILRQSLPSSTASADSNGTLAFGRAGAYDGEYFTGLIDEVRLSNTARYTGASFTPQTTPFSSDANTVGLWHLSEGAGQAVTDSSANGRDGVLGTDATTQQSDPTWSADSPITG
jgi:hypothetical protein